MKICLLVLLAGTCSAGDFVNLTFDDPDLSGPLTPIYPGGPLEGNTSQILRGWRVVAGGQTLISMYFSPVTAQLGIPVTLMENSEAEKQTSLGPYTLSIVPPSVNPQEFRVSQQGMIPADAVGLWIASAGYIQAFINGTKVGEVNPVLGSRVELNVSPYAGQEIDLEFLVRAGDSARFDVLGFTSVPEPSTWALLGLGATALLWQRRRNI